MAALFRARFIGPPPPPPDPGRLKGVTVVVAFAAFVAEEDPFVPNRSANGFDRRAGTCTTDDDAACCRDNMAFTFPNFSFCVNCLADVDGLAVEDTRLFKNCLIFVRPVVGGDARAAAIFFYDKEHDSIIDNDICH